MHLLTIDWDYFFPNSLENDEGGMEALLFDWGHREVPLFAEGFIWNNLGNAFLRRGLELPDTSGHEVGFWKQFRIKPKAPLFVTDSHALVGMPQVLIGVKEVWNFDAHHDLGYRAPYTPEAGFDCGNWLEAAVHDWGVKAHVRYPLWKKNAFLVDRPPEGHDVQFHYAGAKLPVFSKVHVCRSSAWSPPWLDQKFLDFIAASGLRVRQVLGVEDLTDPLKLRSFDPQEAADLLAAIG